ncbi:MAG: carbohydrate ABC transporter substrate-binding protein [Clostridia bacterium]|nr:carbohydrate ABC transporter substrate-binding protein [Clostridia bacterium]
MKANTLKAPRIVALVLVCMLLPAVFGCGPQTVHTGDVDQSLTEEDLEISGRVKLTVDNGSGTDEEAMALRAVISAFEQRYQKTHVIYEESSRGTFPARISSGDIGDVFWVDENDLSNYQRNHNALMPLDSYIKPLNIDMGNVYIGAVDCGRSEGRLYMVPRNLGESVMTFNKDMLKEAGIDYDGKEALDWETFKDYCRRMTVMENGKYVQVGAAMRVWWTVIWQMFFRGFGGEWIDNKSHRVTITDSTEVMTGINELIGAIREGWLYPEDVASRLKGEAYDIRSRIPDSISNVAYACFKTFIDLSGLGTYGKTYDMMGIDWDFCPFPALPTHNISTGATGYVVFNRTNNPNAAAAFALFFLTEAGQRAYHSQSGGGVPLLRSLVNEDFWMGPGTAWTDKNFSAFVMYPDCTRPATVIVQAPAEIAEIFSNDNMIDLFVRILNGQVDIQTAFTSIQTKANETWSTIV